MHRISNTGNILFQLTGIVLDLVYIRIMGLGLYEDNGSRYGIEICYVVM